MKLFNNKSSVIVLSIALFLAFILLYNLRPDLSPTKYGADSHVAKNESGKVITGKKAQAKFHKQTNSNQQPVVMPVAGTTNSPGQLTAYLSKQIAGIVGAYGGNNYDHPADNIFTVYIDRGITQADRIWLNYKLTGIDHHSGVSCSINDRMSFGGYLVKTDSGTSRQRVPLHNSWIVRGENSIRFGIPENTPYGYKITELSIEVERRGSSGYPLVVDAARTLYDGKVYVHGYVNQGKNVSLHIGEKQQDVRDGEFEAVVPVSGDSMVVTAQIDQLTYQKTLRFTRHTHADYTYNLETNIERANKLFVSNRSGDMETGLARLKVPVKALSAPIKLSLSDLRDRDLPALDLGMTNVTGQGRGVRFLPHGNHFAGEGASVALKYDRTKIPDGYTENDIRTYYFDPVKKHWVALERDSVDKTLCVVVSRTTHFTDMINGVIKAPESPETEGFAPTMMNDIKAADPTAKLEMIAPPTANNQGSANLSYPIELPPTRNGMNPNLAITYNSDVGSGWLGEGWDLNVPSITVDTKFGVPTYNPVFESENYLLNGVMLAHTFIKEEASNHELDEKMFFPDRGVVYKRNKNVGDNKNEVYQFFPRIQGEFQLIERIGTQTYDYKWRVTYKNGTKYYYGYNGAVLAKDTVTNAKIAEWKLQSMVDIHGDSVAYIYSKEKESGYGTLQPQAVYLDKIEGYNVKYNANNKEYLKQYEVDFISNSFKAKKTNNARYGFLVSNQKLLDSIIVKYANDQGQLEVLRKYAFNYNTQKVLLTDLVEKISQLDSNSNLIGEHTLNYYNNINTNKYISDAVSNISLSQPNLNQTITNNIAGSVYIGVGNGWKYISKESTIGVNAGYSAPTTTGKSTIIDINGDGLGDQVYERGNKLYFKARLADNSYSNEIPLANAPKSFSTTRNNTLTIGLGLVGSVNARFDGDLLNKSTTDAYFSDVNSDGLIDIVYNEKVYFNYISRYIGKVAVPAFTLNSNLTENPMTNKTIYDLSDRVAGLSRYESTGTGGVEYQGVEKWITYPDPKSDTIISQASPMQDLVRVWEAPYTGNVSITGNVQLLAPIGLYDTLAYAMADGVRIAIQKGGSEIYSLKIDKYNNDSISIDNLNSINVNAGDRIYFRVQSGDEFLSNGNFDDVVWNPTVSYNGYPTDMQYEYDINLNYSNRVYKSSEGFVINKTGYNLIKDLPYGTNITIRSKFIKPETVCAIKIKAFSTNLESQYLDELDNCGRKILNPDYQVEPIFESIYQGNEVINDSIIQTFVSNGNPYIWFSISTVTRSDALNIDWQKIKWTPAIEYSYINQIEDRDTTIQDKIFAGVKYEMCNVYKNVYDEDVFTNQRGIRQLYYLRPTFESYTPNVNGEIVLRSYGTKSIIQRSPFQSDSEGASLPILVEIDDPNFTVEVYFDEHIERGQKFLVEEYIRDDVTTLVNEYENSGFTEQEWYMFTWQYGPLDADYTRRNIKMYNKRYDYDYGSMLRNWGYFEYNAANGRYARPIEEDSLMLPKDENTILFEDLIAIPLAPHFSSKSFLQGYSDNIRLSGDTMRVGRLAMDNLVDLSAYLAPGGRYRAKSEAPDPNAKYYISAPSLLTKQQNFSFSAGVNSSVFPAGKVMNRVLSKLGISSLSSNLATGSFEKILDYIDMNGDGYPDYFNEGKIKYSNSRGSVSDISKTGNKMEKSSSTNVAVGCGSAFITSLPIPFKKASEFAASCEISAGVGVTTSKLQISYLDINGDGLPDIINHHDGKIALNLGYTFTDPFSANSLEHQSTSFSANLGLGIGKDWKNGSIVAGFGIASAVSASDKRMADVNGDGLVDIVRVERATGSGNNIFNYIIPNKLWVRLNTGNEFTSEIEWGQNVALENTLAQSKSINTAFTFGFPIFWGIRMVVTPSVNASTTSSYQLNDVRDYDGDGFADFLKTQYLNNNTSITPIGLTVNYSNIGHTNKLKTATNPLGGSFTIEYGRSLASTDHPCGKRVMTAVVVNDGVSDDGENVKSKFEYNNGKYNRREREFNGFGEVCTRDIDTEVSTSEVTYRKTVQTFDVSSYYTKGNLLKVAVYDQQDNKKQETENSYYCYDVRTRRYIQGEGADRKRIDNYTYNSPVITNGKLKDSIVVYSPLKYTKSTSIEDNSSLITQQAFHTYYTEYDNVRNRLGDLKTYKSSNKGGLLPDGSGDYDYQTEIIYKSEMTDKYYVGGLPAQIIVTDKNDKLYRNIQAHFDHVGFPTHVTSIKQYYDLDTAKYSTTKITYDKYGNIIHKLLPSGMAYTYTYDDKYNMYITQVKDTFGYTYQMPEYDYRFGIPLKTIDINGNVMTQTVDNRGRIVTVTSPNEYVEGAATQQYTLMFIYNPQKIVKNGSTYTQMPYAITKHYDATKATGSDEAKNLETVTFVDGFGRPIQVKKESVVDGANKMIVSGRAKYDAFGRVKEAYYPVVDEMTNKTVFNTAFGDNTIPPTLTTYDVLNRVLTTKLPDNSTTTTSYGIADGKLFTRVTDANGKYQDTYTSGDGKTLKTVQYKAYDNSPESTLTTQFEYDAINQLVKVTDAANKTTESVYDLAGRRTQVTHPATGLTTFKYDVAGNLTEKLTANLREAGLKPIKYQYDFNRLREINYPLHPENDVKYVYGTKDEAGAANGNRAGRLKLLEDGSGTQQYTYGKQGELTEVSRTLVIPNQAVATYVTKTAYDSWNRLLSMTYPDGEVVNYTYNTGGLLTGVASTSNVYVADVKYDKFEQRTYLRYGNGKETNYTYDNLNRQLKYLKVGVGEDYIMNNVYTYDAVGNVRTIENTGIARNAANTMSHKIGGKITHNYEYDNLYRLDSAYGDFNLGDASRTAKYNLKMQYDNMHNIIRKKQSIEQTGIQFAGTLKAGYYLNYTINANNSQQISNIAENSYRTEGTGVNTPTEKSSEYSYDANGNLIYTATGTVKDDKLQATNTRKLLWDEENRLLGISDNGFVSQYWYDASGERTVKESFDNEGVYVNGALSGARTGTSKFTAYISPYMVVSQGGNYTKHVYMGSQRITSKVSNSGIFGTNSPVNVTDLQARLTQQTSKIKERFDSLGVQYSGLQQTGGLVSASPATTVDSYFYHPDHLGSSSLITSGSGDLVQHIQYVPFGEVFVEERASQNSWSTPYKFNGKEQDEETGLCYYGARYYDPRTSVWLSVDPLAEKYPNVGSYVYCAGSPVKYIDPDGAQFIEHNRSRIIAQYSQVRVKLENLHNVTRNSIIAYVNNTNNWNGSIGGSLEVAKVSFVPLASPKEGLATMDKSYYGAADIHNPINRIETKAEISKSTGLPNKSVKTRSINTGDGSFMGGRVNSISAAKGMLVLDVAIFGFQLAGSLSVYDDMSKIQSNMTLLRSAVDMVNKAAANNLIPTEYQNSASMFDILNVVFQGENTTKNNEIMKIGIDILKANKMYDPDKIK